ncbi:mago nashi [Wallemia mellicola]|uniref:Mago nashi n=1 Tax=Wallemia mellicola TaxID=1708541 RepID=A0A4T0UB25_9BASI|nr:mago nashi [Wallemia mellicola]TIB79166.1 hypothetical protein E3Q23_00278 [Wallemia mellicola]TIB87385.1 mago nashi [Wallemia mellicola]TIB90277.1 mago nashi [Wallemia mellicola]TIB97930.1 mago nashi [Wallemia mellicola]
MFIIVCFQLKVGYWNVMRFLMLFWYFEYAWWVIFQVKIHCCRVLLERMSGELLKDNFYLRYYSGHSGKYGHEFLEFEYTRGRLRYANNSNYRNDELIRKEIWLNDLLALEIKKLIKESEIIKENDVNWPKRDINGRQELEIRLEDEHISFETSKIGSLVDVQDSDDPQGLRVFYYLIQDIKCLIFSLISLHFKIKPIT